MFESCFFLNQTLIDDAEACKRKMNNAKTLINGLGGEKIRWTEANRRFQQVTYKIVYFCYCTTVHHCFAI